MKSLVIYKSRSLSPRAQNPVPKGCSDYSKVFYFFSQFLRVEGANRETGEVIVYADQASEARAEALRHIASTYNQGFARRVGVDLDLIHSCPV